MKDAELILGLFYSDENNLIFDNIKFSESLSEENRDKLKMLPYKFLGPLFLTAASSRELWKIEFIESYLSLYQDKIRDMDIFQSFFSLNSSIESEEGITHLFALIGSPHTEDVKMIHKKLIDYIHPSIIQHKIVQENILRKDFKFQKFIMEELNRGLNLIEYSLGSSRKIYWEEQQKFCCVGLLERKISENSKISNLYTFDKDDPLRKQLLPFTPSYYIMAILPDYYENLIKETLEAFGKISILPDIKTIKLSYKDKHAIYLEEYSVERGIKKSYGVVLIPENECTKKSENLSFYKRNLRLILDLNKDLVEVMRIINPDFNVIEKWCTSSNGDLNEIRKCLDDEN